MSAHAGAFAARPGMAGAFGAAKISRCGGGQGSRTDRKASVTSVAPETRFRPSAGLVAVSSQHRPDADRGSERRQGEPPVERRAAALSVLMGQVSRDARSGEGWESGAICDGP